MNLEDLRRKIDDTDAQIVRLIAERIRTAEEIGKKKQEAGEAFEDREREKIVLENVRSLARQKRVNQEDIESVYRQIVTT
ncbi:chorismate mutase [Chloroflexota bacterium]